MPQCNNNKNHQQMPDNAEFEIRKAFIAIIEAEVTQTWQKSISGVHAGEATLLYKYSFHASKTGKRLAAERWARTAKHLARALKQEAKISFLEPRLVDFPLLQCTSAEEYALTEKRKMTVDLISSVRETVQAKFNPIPDNMKRYLERAKLHMDALAETEHLHYVLVNERVNAGYEYGRVLECLILAYEAEPNVKIAA
ncbi:MAG: hypothetical protein ABIQ95_10760 [Bdellovibrionia bacterium]